MQTDGREVWLVNSHISPYDPASRMNHDPKRKRKLLLKRKEINQLWNAVRQKGLTIVPVEIYLSNGKAKLDIAVARGKKLYDKRRDIAERDLKRDMERNKRSDLRDPNMVKITGNDLAIEQIIHVAFGNEQVELEEKTKNVIQYSNHLLNENLKKDFPYYGINTGYGIFHTQKISNEHLAELNRNLILSHAVGTGDDFDAATVRAAMLIRANSLAKGFSGVRLVLIQTLIDMLNCGVTPKCDPRAHGVFR